MAVLNFPVGTSTGQEYTINGITYIYDLSVNTWTGETTKEVVIGPIPGFPTDVPGTIDDAPGGIYESTGCLLISDSIDGPYLKYVELLSDHDLFLEWDETCLEGAHNEVISGTLTHSISGVVQSESTATYKLDRIPNNIDSKIGIDSILDSEFVGDYNPTGYGAKGETTLVYGTTDSSSAKINVASGGEQPLPTTRASAIPITLGTQLQLTHTNSGVINTKTTTTLIFTDGEPDLSVDSTLYTLESTTQDTLATIGPPAITKPQNDGIVPDTDLTTEAYAPSDNPAPGPHHKTKWELYEADLTPLETSIITNVTELDGTWTVSSAPVNSWRSVTYGETSTASADIAADTGLFVAVATDGTADRVMYSTDGITWKAALAAEASEWQSVTYGNGMFVAVATGGTGNRVMYSTDGISWKGASAPGNVKWIEVTYGNGKFVAVGRDVIKSVMYSTNGIDWTAADATEANYWRSVTYGGAPGDEKFVAVASEGDNRVMYSTDAINWTEASAAEASNWAAVTYANGKFVAVAYGGTGNRVMYSTDGISWTGADAPEANTWNSVTYGNGKFLAVAYSGTTNRAMYSTDGISWTSAATVEGGWYSVIYADGKFVSVSSSGTNQVMWSYTGAGSLQTELTLTDNTNLNQFTDGTEVVQDSDGTPETSAITTATTLSGAWTSASSPSAGDNDWREVTYGNGKFVAVASNGTNRVMYSTDGISSTAASAPEANNWYTVTYGGTPGNERFVALSLAGTNQLMYSPDGINWTLGTVPGANPWHYVTYGNGKFVAVSASGTSTAMYSTDGISWAYASVPPTEDRGWQSVAYAELPDGTKRFVAVGYLGNNRVMYSDNGISWTAALAAEINTWNSVTYGNGKFVAVAGDGTFRVMYSTDGISWTSAKAAVASNWYAVTYGGTPGNERFVALSDRGTHRSMYSDDGISWTSAVTPEAAWESVTYADGKFVAVGLPRSVMWSSTGTGVDETQLTLTDDTNLANLRVGDSVTETSGDGTGTIVSIRSDPDPTKDNILTLSPITGDWTGSTSTVTGPAIAAATGTVASVDAAATPPTMTLSTSDGRWLVTHDDYKEDKKLNKTVTDPIQVLPPGPPSDTIDTDIYESKLPPGDDSVNLLTYPLTNAELSPNKAYYARAEHIDDASTGVEIRSGFGSYEEFLTAESFEPVAGDAFGGGYFIAKANYNGTIYNLIVAPKSQDSLTGERQSITMWNGSGFPYQTIWQDQDYGAPVTVAKGGNTSAAAFYWCITDPTGPNKGNYDATNTAGTGIAGFNDWYIPAKNELELMYRHLKPTTGPNNTSSGANPIAVPTATGNYTVWSGSM